MSTNPTIFGRTTGFQASSASLRLAHADDALAVFTRNLTTVMLDGRASTSSMFSARRTDAASEINRATSRGGLSAVARVAACATAPTPASVLTKLQDESGLTFEELATILGTSRRSLHNWKNGGAVHSGNERRLRDVAHAVGQIDRRGASSARDALLARGVGGVRALDLLMEGRYDTAVALASGRSLAAETTGEIRDLSSELAARFDPTGPIEPVGRPRIVVRSGRRKLA